MGHANLLQVSCFRRVSAAGYDLVAFGQQLLGPLQQQAGVTALQGPSVSLLPQHVCAAARLLCQFHLLGSVYCQM